MVGYLHGHKLLVKQILITITLVGASKSYRDPGENRFHGIVAASQPPNAPW